MKFNSDFVFGAARINEIENGNLVRHDLIEE